LLNDDVNMAQSSNDTFPSAMNIAAAVNVKQRLIPEVTALRDAIKAKAQEWITKPDSTHWKPGVATPLGNPGFLQQWQRSPTVTAASRTPGNAPSWRRSPAPCTLNPALRPGAGTEAALQGAQGAGE
jgi:Lyase